ncbi:hypothetical protein D3C87_200840 [compost metagenome]
MIDKKESEAKTVQYQVHFQNNSRKTGTVMIFQQVQNGGISDVASMYVFPVTKCILSWTLRIENIHFLEDSAPVSPKYWIGFGNYEPGAGDFFEIDDMYDKQLIEFPPGITTVDVLLDLNDSWRIL